MGLMSDIAKYQATYYTSVPAAYLLARFSLNAPNDHWHFEWSSIDSIANFKAGDLACGSGTLLSATYSAILDKHVTTSAEQDLEAHPKELHKVLLEKVLLGLDVLGFAAHLSAVTLALHNPSSIFGTTEIYALRLTAEGAKPRLGSVDLLESNQLSPSVALTGEMVGAPEKKGVSATELSSVVNVENLNLVTMNPPFTRSVGGNLLFGALPKDERSKLQKSLAQLLKKRGFSGIGQAGLAAVFILVADRCLRKGGRLALVIPRSLLSGVSWKKIRELLVSKYDIELIITSHQAPNDWNFSENTDLSEILLVARKRGEDTDEPPLRSIVANLWRKPKNEMESVVVSGKLVELSRTLSSHSSAYDMLENANASQHDLMIGEEKLGEAYAVSSSALADAIETWGQLAPFAQSSLNRLAYLFVTSGRCATPQLSFPVKPLSEVAERVGPDVRQVHGAFKLSKSTTTFGAFWYHDSQYVKTLELNSNFYLQPKPGNMQHAQNLWSSGKGKLMVAERLWLVTNLLVTVCLGEEALSDMWWPVRLKEIATSDGYDLPREEHEKIQALWLNSTFGLLGILSLRQDTRGAWIKLKKETLNAIPLLDVSRLTQQQIQKLVQLYVEVSMQDVPPIPTQFQQAAQRQGWRYEVDKALVEIITGETKDLTPIYEMLAREPIICLKPLV